MAKREETDWLEGLFSSAAAKNIVLSMSYAYRTEFFDNLLHIK